MKKYKNEETGRKYEFENEYDAAAHLLGIVARKKFGRNGRVGPIRLESWNEDNTSWRYTGFIGSDVNMGTRSNPIWEFGGVNWVVNFHRV